MTELRFKDIREGPYLLEYFLIYSQLTNAPVIPEEQFMEIIRKLPENHHIFVCYLGHEVVGMFTVLIEQKLTYGGKCVAHVEDVVVDGKRKTLGSPLTTTTNVEDLLYVQIEDDTIDATKLCDGDGIGSGKCLKAVSMSEKICKVTVARPIGKLDREKGGHRIWYTCLKVGECHLTGEVRAAPEPER